MEKEHRPLPDPQQALYDFFAFDESDLAANRLGALSDKQKRELNADQKGFRKSSAVLGSALTVAGLAILFLLIGLPLLQGSKLDLVDLGNIVTSLLIPLAFLGAGIGSLYGGLKTKVDMAEHSVGNVTGPVNLVDAGSATDHHPTRPRALYELHVGEKEFNVYPDLPDVMIQGADYAVYFDNADDAILSVEWLSNN